MIIESSLPTIEIVTKGIEISPAQYAAITACIADCEHIRDVMRESLELHGQKAVPEITRQLIDGEISSSGALIAIAVTVNEQNARALTDALASEEYRCLKAITEVAAGIRTARCEVIRGRASMLEKAERAALVAAGIEEATYLPSEAVLRLAGTRRVELERLYLPPTSLNEVKRLHSMAIPAKK
jgi:hypothetical protein